MKRWRLLFCSKNPWCEQSENSVLWLFSNLKGKEIYTRKAVFEGILGKLLQQDWVYTCLNPHSSCDKKKLSWERHRSSHGKPHDFFSLFLTHLPSHNFNWGVDLWSLLTMLLCVMRATEMCASTSSHLKDNKRNVLVKLLQRLSHV
jgi:hypothetical protein